jgi:hypothetical protein
MVFYDMEEQQNCRTRSMTQCIKSMAIEVDVPRSRDGSSYSRNGSQIVLACLPRHGISNLVISSMRLPRFLFSIAQDILQWYALYCFQRPSYVPN